jgi:hypothetical protein
MLQVSGESIRNSNVYCVMYTKGWMFLLTMWLTLPDTYQLNNHPYSYNASIFFFKYLSAAEFVVIAGITIASTNITPKEMRI